MSLCPEFEERARMSEADFWAYVYRDHMAQEPDDLDGDDTPTTYQTDPCPECGERGPCGYDTEGRAMVHIATEEET